MVTEEKCDKKCSRCRTYRYPKQFFNEKGRELKTCDICREKSKIEREKNKCWKCNNSHNNKDDIRN